MYSKATFIPLLCKDNLIIMYVSKGKAQYIFFHIFIFLYFFV